MSALLLMLAGLASPPAAPQVLHVCSEPAPQCEYVGGAGIQEAIDAAQDGDHVQLAAGIYRATHFRDVPYLIHQIRGFVVIDGKDISLGGADGTILDGAVGPATSAIVVRNGSARISGMSITGFRWGEKEDEIYDGHGVFAIDSAVELSNVGISKFQKMGLSIRGTSRMSARNVLLEDGHVAIWMREAAQLNMEKSVVRRMDGSGIAAYDNSQTRISASIFAALDDDALYTENEAEISVDGSLLMDNRPYALRALDHSVIRTRNSVFVDNENRAQADGRAIIDLDCGNLFPGRTGISN